MSFVERVLRFTFSGEHSGTLEVAGLRAVVSVQAFPAKLGNFAQVRIWGLSMDQMNAYSSRLSTATGIDKFNLAIEAGDIGGKLQKIVHGAIWRSYIDLAESPESAFNVSVAGSMFAASTPMASQSQSGAQSAATLIQSICNLAGFTLHVNGNHPPLRNHVTYGSAIDQIADIARAAKISWYVEGNDVWIWPQNGNRDDEVVDIGPDTGMVGYPEWWEAGIIVTSLFNSRIQIGRQLNVTSSIPKANGKWPIIQVQHELGTMFDRAPWFTTAICAAPLAI